MHLWFTKSVLGVSDNSIMDYSGKYQAVRALDEGDDYNHPVEDSLVFNESRYFNIFDKNQALGGWFRIGNRPNQGYAEVSCCIYLPSGEVGFIYSKAKQQEANLLSAAGLRFTIHEAFKRIDLEYTGPIYILKRGEDMEDPKRAFSESPQVDCSVRIEFNSVAPPHGGELLDDDGKPFDEGEGQQFARAHYDQHMRGQGTIQLGSDNYHIDGFGMRDHSWGPRIWQAIPWYRWFPIAFDESLGFCLIICQKPDGHLLHTGFVYDGDDVLSHIDKIDLQSHYDKNNYPTGFTLKFKAENGRDYTLTGETVMRLPCRHLRKLDDGSVDKTRIMESMTRFQCKGKTCYGMAEYLDHMSDGVYEGVVAGN